MTSIKKNLEFIRMWLQNICEFFFFLTFNLLLLSITLFRQKNLPLKDSHGDFSAIYPPMSDIFKVFIESYIIIIKCYATIVPIRLNNKMVS